MTVTARSSADPARVEVLPHGVRERIHSHLTSLIHWRALMLREPALRHGAPLGVGPRTRITMSRGARFERGSGVYSPGDLNISIQGVLSIGQSVFLGRWVNISCLSAVTIGRDTLLAERVSVHDGNHVIEPLADVSARATLHTVAPVVIGERVWIGANSVIVAGVTIGDDAVVAANSVVTRDVAPGSLVGGVPAALIRQLH